MTRRRIRILTAAALVALVVGAGVFVAQLRLLAPMTVTAIFPSAHGIYPGDDVRVAGVKVGTVTDISPAGTTVTVTLKVDHGVRVPADARAVIVAQNLVSSRFVQLAPGYTGGPLMADGTVIPDDRTAVPVEWDEVKEQLNRLATDLGPTLTDGSSSIGRFIDSAANAMSGNGDKLRNTLAQLSKVGRVLAEGSGDITEIIRNLNTFVAVLRDSNQQIVQFQDRLASLSSVLDGGRSDLDAALTNLNEAVVEVQRFVANTRDKAAEQVTRLGNVTQNLVDHRDDLEQVLHVSPTAIANAYNMFDPRTGGASGVFILNNMSNPSMFFCGMIGALENVTSVETGKLCEQTLGPGLNAMNFNYLPFPFNPLMTSAPSPGKLIYSEPSLQPGGPGTVSDFMPIAPQDSAYPSPPN
ncbi:MCE family protein, partial [Mycobacterium sp. ACS4331]|uniref:MCE family protein n=1 Tax=Mycobacterium sp. ACS4331 TaxID=1834121 RepID=UPI000800F8D3